MKYLLSYKDFLLYEETERQKELALDGYTSNNYLIQLTFENGSELLLEHERYQKFQKTNNRYRYDPENPAIPVKAHYHIYPTNSKKELYAVNVDDGKAHHKSNRGHTVPKKEADELRQLGVNLPANNILESTQIPLNETAMELFIVFIVIEVDETK